MNGLVEQGSKRAREKLFRDVQERAASGSCQSRHDGHLFVQIGKLRIDLAGVILRRSGHLSARGSFTLAISQFSLDAERLLAKASEILIPKVVGFHVGTLLVTTPPDTRAESGHVKVLTVTLPSLMRIDWDQLTHWRPPGPTSEETKLTS